MGVGGTFDVVSGKVKRAPVWMQHYGLEWLYRVMQEPRRLFIHRILAWMKRTDDNICRTRVFV